MHKLLSPDTDYIIFFSLETTHDKDRLNYRRLIIMDRKVDEALQALQQSLVHKDLINGAPVPSLIEEESFVADPTFPNVIAIDW